MLTTWTRVQIAFVCRFLPESPCSWKVDPKERRREPFQRFEGQRPSPGFVRFFARKHRVQAASALLCSPWMKSVSKHLAMFVFLSVSGLFLLSLLLGTLRSHRKVLTSAGTTGR